MHSPNEEEGSGGTSIVSKKLDGHPIMRFLATSAASITAMTIAGAMVKRGGVKIGYELQQAAKRSDALSHVYQGSARKFDNVQKLLDEYEGITRKVEFDDAGNRVLFKRRGDVTYDEDGNRIVNKLTDNRPRTASSSFVSDSRAIRYQNPDRDPWSYKQEIQQRLVRQARRLPYETAGFYATDRLLLDPMLGNDQDKRRINWANPVDVVGDFAEETIKNLAFNVMPFEVGVGMGKTAYRNMATQIANNPTHSPGVESVRFLLEQVGASATDLIHNTMRLSNQSIGAFSQLVEDAKQNGKGFAQYWRELSAVPSANPPSNANFGRRLWDNAKVAVNDKHMRRSALDAMPGPFQGLGSGLSQIRHNFRRHGQIYDDWQNVTSGRVSLSAIRRTQNGEKRYDDLVGYMRKGGNSFIEKYASDLSTLGGGGPMLGPDGKLTKTFTKSDYTKFHREQAYKRLFSESLQSKMGLSVDDADKFVRTAQITLPSGVVDPTRVRFGEGLYTGDVAGWYGDLIKRARQHKINLSDKQEDLYDTIKYADARFNKPFQDRLMQDISAQYKKMSSELIPAQATSRIRNLPESFERFTGPNLQGNRDYLTRRTAEVMGIDTRSKNGFNVGMDAIRNELAKKGMDPDDLYLLRGYLMDQKEITAPWKRYGRNLFGFKPLSVGEATGSGYFSAHDDDTQRIVKDFVDYRARNSPISTIGAQDLASYRMRLGQVYTSPDGRVLDFGRMGRSFMRSIDTFTNETKIPILNFNPIQLLGHQHRLAQRNAPSIQLSSGLSGQPLLQGSGESGSYLWLRKKGNKGSVFGMDAAFGGASARQIEGEYHSYITSGLSMGGRLARLYSGESGSPDPGRGVEGRRGRFQRMFDISTNQENSLFVGQQSVWKRFTGARRDRASASANPNRFAERWNEITERLRKDPSASLTPDEVLGTEESVGLLRNVAFNSRSLRELSEDPSFAAIFEPLGGLNIHEIAESRLAQIAQQVLDTDVDDLLPLLRDDQGALVKRSQQITRNLLQQGRSQDNFWDLETSQMAQAVGVNRRVEQLRSSLAGYLVMTSQFRSGQNINTGFEGTVSSLFSKADELFLAGRIGARERKEFRAAVLSLQVETARNRSYVELRNRGSEIVPQNLNTETVRNLLDQGITGADFSSIADFQIGSAGGIRGFFERGRKDAFAMTPYRRDMEVNPLGAHSRFFVPTTATVAHRSGIAKAIKGLTTSWNDPSAVSTGSAVMAHMGTRLNRYLEPMGMGLTPENYSGAADFYMRGLIGRRVLPLTAAGATFMAADRTLGGMVHTDEDGNPIYSPLALGAAADVVKNVQATAAGLIPGGQTFQEKLDELETGEVPIRQGRYWLLGSTPFKGGRIQYFRPSWYQRLKSGAEYIPEKNETPLERLAFGYDFSPLRPLDPYRRERQDALTRPYPVSGDYFTGPWGPLNPVLNATLGRVLKPRREMHPVATAAGLEQYAPVGERGAYFSGGPNTLDPMMAGSIGAINQGYMNAGPGTSSMEPFYSGLGYSAPYGRAAREISERATAISQAYSAQASSPGRYTTLNDTMVPYGVPVAPGYMSPRVLQTGSPINPGSLNSQVRDFGYRIQETMGIYGFAGASLRSSLGLGSQDFTPDRAVLEPAHRGYSSSRAFWNLNIGGVGDVPSPNANLEISEIVRRLVPRDQQGIQYINDLPNLMGQMYPWLPGREYELNPLKTGDPYRRADSEMLLPGTGYRRTHTLFPDEFGEMGLANIHDILGSVAPWSPQYDAVDRMINSTNMPALAKAKVSQTRAQMEAMRMKQEFTPYEYYGMPTLNELRHPGDTVVRRGAEYLAHADTFINNKFYPIRTAQEDWEREHVYGVTFPTWTSPIESYVTPVFTKATQRGPGRGFLSGAGFGALFGRTPRARLFGAIAGGSTGLAAGLYGRGYKAVTGDRYIPMERRKELALEENIDILTYTRSMYNAARAHAAGDMATAQRFIQESKRTMYGVDLNALPEQVVAAVPERKRQHFRAMLYAPERDREQILSTSSRLERRMLQAAWGMQVEARPNLPEYFQEHELPPPDSPIWNPLTDMEHVKIKMGQHMGLDMAQMGYYPQQIREANLVNPAYPNFQQDTSPRGVAARIRNLLQSRNAYGDVVALPNIFGEDRVELTAGVF